MLQPFVFLLLSSLCSWSTAQTFTGPEDPRISIELELQTPSQGISITADGRIFVAYTYIDGTSGGPQVVEYNKTTNTSTPYPNEAWNTYSAGDDVATHFIGVNAQRIGPDGNLWIVDKGATGIGEPVLLPDGPKVVVVNVTTNEVARVYEMGNVTRINSFMGW